MKNSKLVKSLLTIVMLIMISMFMVGQVYADEYQDLSTAINGTSSGSNSASNRAANNAASGSSSLNSASRGNNTLTTNGSNTANTANTSTYNSTNLPYTGIGDSIPTVILIVVFGISAVYAYKKIKDYRNI